MKKIFYILFVFFYTSYSYAQSQIINEQFVIQHWGMEEGVGTNRILKIESDKDGFIWLATDNGLVRFDGFRFVKYNRKNTELITNNYIANFFKDNNGDICFTANKKCLIKISNFSFNPIFPDTTLVKSIYFKTTLWVQDSLWVRAFNGLFLLTKNKVLKKNQFYGIPSEKVSTFSLDRLGILWVAIKNKGLFKYTTNGFKKVFDNCHLEDKTIRRIFFDSQNRVWVASKSGVVVFKNSRPISSKFIEQFSTKLLRILAEDRYGNIWIATSRSGLFVLDKENNVISISKKNGLSDDSVTDIKIIGDNIWVATVNGGLNLINQTKLKVLNSDIGLSSPNVNSFYCDSDNSLLIGTNKGLFRASNECTSVVKYNFLADKHIYAINRDKKGNLFVGTRLFGLFVVNKNGKIVANYNSKNKLKKDFVRAIFVDENNSLYVGTNVGGVAIIKGDSVRHITKQDGLSNELTAFIHKAKDGRLWIGTSGGGVNILLDDKVVEVIDSSNGLKGNIISSIYEDSDGVIWLSVNGGGLSRISKEGISNFTTKDGLFSNELINIACDENNVFWFTTLSGIFSVKKIEIERYSKNEISSINYNFYGKADGMPIERCTGASPQSAIIVNGKTLFVSTALGAVVINTTNNKPMKNEIRLVVDKVAVNDIVIARDKYLEFPHNPQKVEFSFSAINYRTPHYVKIYYKLKGIDSEWIEAGINRSVSYSYLPFGKYTFEVKTNDANRKGEYAAVTINIPPQIWERTEFQIVTFFVFIFLLILITRYVNAIKYRRKLHIIELEQALEKERIRISKDMHDEVGSNLTKMSLLGEIAKKYIDDDEKLSNYLNQITATGVEVASSLDELVWTVNPKNDKLGRTISYIVQFVDDFLSSTEIHFSFIVPDEIPEVYVSAEFRHNLFSVIKEAVNNSVKHSQCTKITLTFSIDENRLKIVINDNGIGCDFNSTSSFSNGLSNMKSRIKSISGQLKLYNRNPSGVELTIIVDI